MGSLVPGWDSNDLGVPKALIDMPDKDDKPQGYFARLRSQRYVSDTGVGLSVPPLLSLEKEHDLPRAQTMAHEPPASPPPFVRTGSLPIGSYPTASLSSPGAAKPSPLRGKNTGGYGSTKVQYEATDWSLELDTLRKPGVLRRTSVPATGAYGSGMGHHDDHHGTAWWRGLETGHLNERPDAEPNGNRTGVKLDMPQFTKPQKLEYGAE